MISKEEREQLEKLFQLIEQSDIQRFELTKEQFSLQFQKEGVTTSSEMNVARGERYVQMPIPSEREEKETVEEVVEQQTLPTDYTVTAPMLGTFYKKASPTQEPFVQVGDEIVKGQTICILEAMKLLNEVHSEVDGKIEEIYVEEGEIVEFGQPLFRVSRVDADD